MLSCTVYSNCTCIKKLESCLMKLSYEVTLKSINMSLYFQMLFLLYCILFLITDVYSSNAITKWVISKILNSVIWLSFFIVWFKCSMSYCHFALQSCTSVPSYIAIICCYVVAVFHTILLSCLTMLLVCSILYCCHVSLCGPSVPYHIAVMSHCVAQVFHIIWLSCLIMFFKCSMSYS